MKKIIAVLTIVVLFSQTTYAGKAMENSVFTPPFFGIIFIKSEHTEEAINQETKLFLKHFPEAKLNENADLIAFSVAMNSWDLEKIIEDLEERGLTKGKDFVVTNSHHGALNKPEWLIEHDSEEHPNLKLYTLDKNYKDP